MVCFTMAWSPYALISICSTIRGGGETLPMFATFVPVLVCKAAALINPMVYLTFNHQLRKEVASLMFCCGCRCGRFGAIHEDSSAWDKTFWRVLDGKRYHVGLLRTSFKKVAPKDTLTHAERRRSAIMDYLTNRLTRPFLNSRQAVSRPSDSRSFTPRSPCINLPPDRNAQSCSVEMINNSESGGIYIGSTDCSTPESSSPISPKLIVGYSAEDDGIYMGCDATETDTTLSQSLPFVPSVSLPGSLDSSEGTCVPTNPNPKCAEAIHVTDDIVPTKLTITVTVHADSSA